MLLSQNLYSQFTVRKTFDGSKNENKPASIILKEDHKSADDFFEVDIAIRYDNFIVNRIRRWNFELSALPKLEYHRSNQSESKVNKLEFGFNYDFIPYGVRTAPGSSSPKLAPYLIASNSIKRNYETDETENKFFVQLTGYSSIPWYPGSRMRFGHRGRDFIRYYPYFGYERFRLPDLIIEGSDEVLKTVFFRFYFDARIIRRRFQIIFDGKLRKNISNSSGLNDKLNRMVVELNYYPGGQDNFSIGYEFKNGYEDKEDFKSVSQSSISLKAKFN